MLINIIQHGNQSFYKLKYTSWAGATSLVSNVDQPPVHAGFFIMEQFDLFNQPPIRSAKNSISQQYVKSIFDYKDGFLYWKVKIARKVKVGEKAGGMKKYEGKPRWFIRLNKTYYASARLIFLWHKGYLPETVDHRDHNTLNDFIENLRAATRLQNNRNTSSHKNAASNYLGVSVANRNKFISDDGSVGYRYSYWQAQITIETKHLHLGYFKTEDDAAFAYNVAAAKYFGEFANLNIIDE